MADSPKETLGRYELITRIAAGGMAEIFLARETGLIGFERYVVIKRILPHLADDPSFIAMFLREARVVVRLNHPNIVQIHDLGEEDGNYFLAMEYIHGCTLRELQVFSHRLDRPVPPNVAVAMVAEACRGLHAAHELTDLEGRNVGIVHRDVSPQNLMVTPHGHVKVLDFGIAKGEGGFETTKGEGIRGKYGYMSPEQCLRKPLDRRSDVFSLAVILWELCANQALFKRESELEMMNAIIDGESYPIQFDDPSFPAELDAVIMRGLENDREARFESAEAFRQELTRVAQSIGLDLSFDRVAEFVKEVAAERIAERDAVLEKAKEHALSAEERRRLIHATGDASTFDSDIAEVFLSKERELFKKEQERKRREREREGLDGPDHTDELDEPTPPRKGIGGVIAIFAVLVGLLVVGVLYITDSDAPSSSQARAEAQPESQTDPATAGDADASSELAPAPVFDGPPVVIGWAPTVGPDVLEAELEPLRRYLIRALERPVTFPIAANYQDLARKLTVGEIAYGVFPPLLFVRTSRDHPDLELIAVKEFEGATRSSGYLLVKHSDAIHEFKDLKGLRFCFTDPDSTSGHFLPRAYIRAQGFDPDDFIGRIHWSGDHLQVMRDLVDGHCDAAATYSGAYLTASSFGIPTGRFRIFAQTGQIPQDVIVAGPSLSTEDRKALKNALLSFEPEKAIGAPFVGDNQRITGFAEATDAMFTSLRKALRESDKKK